MEINWLAVLVAALVPTITGFIWYHPKVFGTAWMNAAGMTEEKMKGGNMAVIFGLSFVFSFMLAMATNGLAIHQMNFAGLFMNDPEGTQALNDFISKYATRHRTFSHGLVHGIIAGLFIALPIVATNAMFERKGAKYIAVNAGYWILTIGLMGGLLCAWV